MDHSQRSKLVELLEEATRAYVAESGRPLSATRLGSVLGEHFRDMGLPRGPGAYKPVMEAAVAEGRLVKVWNGDTSTLALLPNGREVPCDWSTSPADRSTARGPARSARELGLPQGDGYLDREIYRAFTGLSKPRWLDLSSPPIVRVLESEAEGALFVEPVPAKRVFEEWARFAQEREIEGRTVQAVIEQLQREESSAWHRIDAPGVDASTARQFKRSRLNLLIRYVRDWIEGHGQDPSKYFLAAHRERKPTAPPSRQVAAPRDPEAYALRNRLKQIIERMSVQQLYELRIPAEFLGE